MTSPATQRCQRTLGAALVELRGRLAEQRVHREGGVEVLDAQRVRILQRRRRVRASRGRPPPRLGRPVCIRVAALGLAVAALLTCARARTGAVTTGM